MAKVAKVYTYMLTILGVSTISSSLLNDTVIQAQYNKCHTPSVSKFAHGGIGSRNQGSKGAIGPKKVTYKKCILYSRTYSVSIIVAGPQTLCLDLAKAFTVSK